MSSRSPDVPKPAAALEPLVVTPREACRLLSVGNTRLYQLIGAGELETFRDGRTRRITMASIRRRIACLLAADGATATTARGPERRKPGRPHKLPPAPIERS